MIHRSIALLARYSLVATPDECRVIQEQCTSDDGTYLLPVNLNDLQTMARLFTERLAPSDHLSLFSVSHAAFMLHQLVGAMRALDAEEVCISLVTASIEFYWRLFSLPEKEIPWNKIGAYGFGPVIVFK